jgi:hypothetical protein
VNRFKEVRESINDNARDGRPSTSHVGENIQRVHDLVMSDRRITSGIITDILGISEGSVQTILKRRFKHAEAVCKNYSKSFDSGAKATTCCLYQYWIEHEEGSYFLQMVITGDESWIYSTGSNI